MSSAWFADDAREHLLALHRAPGLGSARLRRVCARFPHPAELFGPKAAGARGELPPETQAYLAHPDWRGVAADLRWLEAPGRSLLTPADQRYPERLKAVEDAPLLLFVRGDPEVLAVPQLAIVGSRNPTRPGRDNAFAFAEALAEAGLAITSGLAIGVDAASHEGAIAGGGLTVAVMATGPDLVYPRRHRELADRIVQSGAAVTELPTGSAAHRHAFPRRNRIISGLALGVLVVEAALRSGSLITARLGMEQGREVFAIPGSIHNPMARGCHLLIRQGAKLVESVADVLEEIGAQLDTAGIALAATASPESEELDADYARLVEEMGYDPISVDALVARAGLTAQAVSSMLLRLELNGYVSSMSGGLYVRTPRNRK